MIRIQNRTLNLYLIKYLEPLVLENFSFKLIFSGYSADYFRSYYLCFCWTFMVRALVLQPYWAVFIGMLLFRFVQMFTMLLFAIHLYIYCTLRLFITMRIILNFWFLFDVDISHCIIYLLCLYITCCFSRYCFGRVDPKHYNYWAA